MKVIWVKVKVGIIQMSCVKEKDINLRKAMENQGSGRQRGADRLPAGAVHLALFL